MRLAVILPSMDDMFELMLTKCFNVAVFHFMACLALQNIKCVEPIKYARSNLAMTEAFNTNIFGCLFTVTLPN